jgi:hypothetical protein
MQTDRSCAVGSEHLYGRATPTDGRGMGIQPRPAGALPRH